MYVCTTWEACELWTAAGVLSDDPLSKTFPRDPAHFTYKVNSTCMQQEVKSNKQQKSTGASKTQKLCIWQYFGKNVSVSNALIWVDRGSCCRSEYGPMEAIITVMNPNEPLSSEPLFKPSESEWLIVFWSYIPLKRSIPLKYWEKIDPALSTSIYGSQGKNTLTKVLWVAIKQVWRWPLFLSGCISGCQSSKGHPKWIF